VRLGREVEDDRRALLAQEREHGVQLAHVEVDEPVARLAARLLEPRDVAGVGERVEADDARGPARLEAPDQRRADEPGGAGDEGRAQPIEVSHARRLPGTPAPRAYGQRARRGARRPTPDRRCRARGARRPTGARRPAPTGTGTR